MNMVPLGAPSNFQLGCAIPLFLKATSMALSLALLAPNGARFWFLGPSWNFSGSRHRSVDRREEKKPLREEWPPRPASPILFLCFLISNHALCDCLLFPRLRCLSCANPAAIRSRLCSALQHVQAELSFVHPFPSKRCPTFSWMTSPQNKELDTGQSQEGREALETRAPS